MVPVRSTAEKQQNAAARRADALEEERDHFVAAVTKAKNVGKLNTKRTEQAATKEAATKAATEEADSIEMNGGRKESKVSDGPEPNALVRMDSAFV